MLNYWEKNQLFLKYAPANKREIALSVFAADLLFSWPNYPIMTGTGVACKMTGCSPWKADQANTL